MSAQDQIDTRAIAIASAAAEKSDLTYSLLSDHITSCARTQRANFVLIIMTLFTALGTLVTLYVLPQHGVTITTQTTTTMPTIGTTK